MRRDYLEYTNKHRSIHPQDDFFDPEIAAFMLADQELAAELLARMDISGETKSYLVAYGIRLRAETADVLYAALRYQGYSDEAILATDEGLDLMLSLFLLASDAWERPQLRPPMAAFAAAHPELLFSPSDPLWRLTAAAAFARLDRLPASRCELLLYLLHRYPYPVAEATFSALARRWATFVPTFRDDIETSLKLRNALARAAGVDPNGGPVPVALSGDPEQIAQSTPLLTSAGLRVDPAGPPMSIEWRSESTLLKKSEQEYRTDYTKVRGPWWAPPMARSTRSVATKVPLTRKPDIVLTRLTVRFMLGDVDSGPHEFVEEPATRSYDPAKDSYHPLTEDDVTPRRTWLFAIAREFFVDE